MNYTPPRPLSSEILRPLLIDCILRKGLHQTGNAAGAVFDLAKEKGLIDVAHPGPSFQGHGLLPGEEESVRILLWEFIMQGILVPGMDRPNPNLPWFSLTPYGSQCFKEGGEALPYDPDGYLKSLREEIANIDGDVLTYISESLQCFRRGLMLASTVMLGVAAERAALLMFDAFIEAHPDSRRDELHRKITKQRMFKTMYENFRKSFDALPKGYIPAEMSDDIEVQLDAVQSWIRSCRNDDGHPTGRTVSRDQAFANLQLFRPYCRRLFELQAHFHDHKIP